MGDLQRQGTGWQGGWAKPPRNSGICLACASITVQIRCLPISPFLLPVNPVLRAAHIYLPVKGTENVIYCHKATISSKRCSSLVCNVKTEHSSQNDVRQAQGREEVAYCPHLPPVAASPAAQNLISGRK